MSRGDEPRRGDGESDRPQYEVGFGKPPKKHQFVKGRSGNPKGRPKKEARIDHLGVAAQRANHYLLEEAYRTVTIREGEARISMTSIQAAMRSLNLKAVKGDRLSQQLLFETVHNIERAQREERIADFKASIDYKREMEQRIEDARRQGRLEPSPLPHPDDIIVDFVAGRATIEGPITKQDKEEWDRMLGCRDHLQETITEIAERTRKRARQ